MPRIVIGEGALHYERQGVGFPVMLVSGLSGFASFWADLVPSFAKSFDVVTHDHRGIGQSDLTRSGFTVDRMAADVIGLMDALEIDPKSHPAWTGGQQRLLDTGGQLARFNRRFQGFGVKQ